MGGVLVTVDAVSNAASAHEAECFFRRARHRRELRDLDENNCPSPFAVARGSRHSHSENIPARKRERPAPAALSSDFVTRRRDSARNRGRVLRLQGRAAKSLLLRHRTQSCSRFV